MVTVNILANALPIGGRTTGDVSDAYPNLFAPAGFTFAIWGLIYVLLGGFVLYQLGVIGKNSPISASAMAAVGPYFALSSLANVVWIFAWQYDHIFISLLLMAAIFLCLAVIFVRVGKLALSPQEKLWVRVPFGVYFGWITVAAIANITVWLVSLGFTGWGLSEQGWTIIILLAGLLIGGATILKSHCVAYGLVLIWAYFGILMKHVSQSGFDLMYPVIVITASVCIAGFAAATVLAAVKKK